MQPFYMTYPIQRLYQTRMTYEKDLNRMQEMYPMDVKKIMKVIDDRLDELEFAGSRIYDEEPDREMMRQEMQRLSEKIKNIFGIDEYGLVSVLFLTGLYHRRCRYRGCRMWW